MHCFSYPMIPWGPFSVWLHNRGCRSVHERHSHGLCTLCMPIPTNLALSRTGPKPKPFLLSIKCGHNMVKNRLFNRNTEYNFVPTKLRIRIPVCIQQNGATLPWSGHFTIFAVQRYSGPSWGGWSGTFTRHCGGIAESMAVAAGKGQLTGSYLSWYSGHHHLTTGKTERPTLKGKGRCWRILEI